MSHESSGGWIDRRVRAAMRKETDALRATITDVQKEMAELRAMIQAVGVEMSHRAAQADATAQDRDQRVEALRLRIEGLSAQHRWDTDQLRDALTAIAERLPL